MLRLHPSVPIELKICQSDDTLPDGTFVPKGAGIVFSPYAMNRDSRLWERPEEFDPSRWLTESGSFTDRSSFAFPSFNAGPRICLGKNLAYLEVKLLTTKLLEAFDFEQPSPKHCGDYFSTVTMPMKGGLPMKVVPRK